MMQSAKILCVDDEPNVLKAIERLFLDEDYELFCAGSAKEGLEILENESSVQVVISDYRMPEMDGIDFLKQVCDRWPDTVRIVLSGYADTALVVEAINEGEIYKFIPKPWNDDELKVTIIKAVDLYFLQKNNAELAQQLQKSNEELTLLNENLEKIVLEKTEEVLFQNKVMAHSQHILDSLPVGVLGLDMEGLIVQSNEAAARLFGKDGAALVGESGKDMLPAEVLEFVANVKAQDQVLAGNFQLKNNNVTVKGINLKSPGGQEGAVLVFDKAES